MILPKQPQTTGSVAAHYDELDTFYRDIWGEHVHHGYWATGHETSAEAVVALIDLLADRLDLAPGMTVCDIGCGYGASARHIAARHDVSVTGVTISSAQASVARAHGTLSGRVVIKLQDWLCNDLPSESVDRAYAIESSEHMPDKQCFFNETYRVLRPNGVLVLCAWLAGDAPRAWEVRHLLEPICREGRLPGMGTRSDYQAMAEQAGFRLTRADDLSAQVSRTWWICIQRVLRKLVTRPHYLRYLLDRTATNRIFAITLLRILLAYRSGAMRYDMLAFSRPS